MLPLKSELMPRSAGFAKSWPYQCGPSRSRLCRSGDYLGPHERPDGPCSRIWCPAPGAAGTRRWPSSPRRAGLCSPSAAAVGRPDLVSVVLLERVYLLGDNGASPGSSCCWCCIPAVSRVAAVLERPQHPYRSRRVYVVVVGGVAQAGAPFVVQCRRGTEGPVVQITNRVPCTSVIAWGGGTPGCR